MAARKGWDNLSDKYRDRLLRGGITKQQYEQGTPLASARGHVSAAVENYNKRVKSFARHYARFTPAPAWQIERHIKSLGRYDGERYMRHTQDMGRFWYVGEHKTAKRMFIGRNTRIPDYMHYYHGTFT